MSAIGFPLAQHLPTPWQNATVSIAKNICFAIFGPYAGEKCPADVAKTPVFSPFAKLCRWIHATITY
jgi:hypothetical protein